MWTEVRRRFALLTPAERLRWMLLGPLGAAAATLEAAGGAVVFILLSRVLSGQPQGRAFLGFALAAAAIHLGRNVVAVLIAWWRARLVAAETAVLSSRLLDAYVRAPWTFHLQRPSAVLLETIREAPRPFFDVFQAVSGAATEAAIVGALVAVALFAAPLTISAALVGLTAIVLLVAALMRRVLDRGGERQFELWTALTRHVQHGLGAIKELKVLGREHAFADAFARDADALARLEGRRALLDVLPRVVIETAFIVGLISALVAYSGDGGATVLPLLGLYAYTGFRVAPAAHRISVHINTLRWGIAASGAVADDLQQLEGNVRRAPAPRPSPLPFTRELRVDNVSFRYPSAVASALERATLTLTAHESLALVGPTGSGKTTIVDIIAGLLEPSEGRVVVDGVDIRGRTDAWQANIGYVPQFPFLTDDTLARNVALGLPDAAIDRHAVREALAAAQLLDVADALPQGIDTPLGEHGARLSGGERQRVAIARALYGRPALLLLDEATSAIDEDTEREFAAALDRLHGRRAMIVVAHRMSTARRCDRMVMVVDGTVEPPAAVTGGVRPA